MSERRRVAITGMGAVTPLGVGARPLYERAVAGDCAIEDGFGRALGFVANEFLSTKDVRRLDRVAQFAVVAAGEAIEQAGWSESLPYESTRVSLILGTGIGGLSTFEHNHDLMRDRGTERISPLGIPMFMPNAAAAAISIRHGIQGTSFGVVSACASGGHALAMAARLIQYGDADAVVAGGSEATCTEFGIGSFVAMQALSKSGHSRPFDARRDGFVMGEGAGVVVLEELSAAQARGATIYGEICGFGASSDAGHLTAPDPTGQPAAAAIRGALADAEITADEVSYINAHGTSTELNDAAETNALKVALGQRAYEIPTSSTKGAMGHLLGAAGAVEAVVTVQALNDRVALPTIGYGEPDPACDLDYVPNSSRPMVVAGEGAPYALSTSFAFGGHNVVLALRGAH